VTIDAIYRTRCNTPSDISEHLPTLRRFASLCDHVTEFGFRGGHSCSAFLAARPDKVVSYDLNVTPALDELQRAAHLTGTDFQFVQGDTREVVIAPTDLLFVDTRHTFSQMETELRLHAGHVRRYLAMHDTELFGDNGEDGERGIWPAIASWARCSPEWRLTYYTTANNGLAVFARPE
jgi:hypothetical protein